MKVLRPKGQSLVEFAFALPILLLLVIGVFDLSQLFLTKVVLNNAAREGAYYLAYHRSDKVACGSSCFTYTNTKAAVKAEAQNSGITINDADITISNCCTSGQPVEVTVVHVVNLAIIDFFTGPVTLSSSVRMMVQ